MAMRSTSTVRRRNNALTLGQRGRAGQGARKDRKGLFVVIGKWTRSAHVTTISGAKFELLRAVSVRVAEAGQRRQRDARGLR